MVNMGIEHITELTSYSTGSWYSGSYGSSYVFSYTGW